MYTDESEQAKGFGGPPRRARRPWTQTGAAVVAFIAAGIEIIGGTVLLAGGGVLGAVESAADDIGTDSSSLGGLIMLLGLASLVTGGCYIWAGVTALGGMNGIVLPTVAGVAAAVNLITLIASGGDGGVLGLILAALALGLFLSPMSRRFLRENGAKTLLP